jgi:hypothetical protein
MEKAHNTKIQPVVVEDGNPAPPVSCRKRARLERRIGEALNAIEAGESCIARRAASLGVRVPPADRIAVQDRIEYCAVRTTFIRQE